SSSSTRRPASAASAAATRPARPAPTTMTSAAGGGMGLGAGSCSLRAARSHPYYRLPSDPSASASLCASSPGSPTNETVIPGIAVVDACDGGRERLDHRASVAQATHGAVPRRERLGGHLLARRVNLDEPQPRTAQRALVEPRE